MPGTLPTHSMNRAAAQRIADSNPNATVYEYEYDHHEPWPVSRVRSAVQLIRARASTKPETSSLEGVMDVGEDGAAQDDEKKEPRYAASDSAPSPPGPEEDEVALFQRSHPKLAALAATDDPSTQRLLDVLIDARGRAERGAISEDQATALVQAACMHSARTRQGR